MEWKDKKKARAWYRNRTMTKNIALKLLDGPEWMEPLKKRVSFEELVPVFKVVVCPLDYRKPAYSYSVFVDDTTNRDEDFLTPVVRKVEWHRPREHQSRILRKWPIITVLHHTMTPSEQQVIHKMLLRLDLSLRTLDFFSAGLITDRTTPRGSYPKKDWPEQRAMVVTRRNFCQYVKFGLDAYAGRNKHIEKATTALVKTIENCCTKPDLRPCIEVFQSDIYSTKVPTPKSMYRPRRG